MEIWRKRERTSFGFSAENPAGERNGGSKGRDCEKLRPCITLQHSSVVTLCRTEGPGMVTHLWFTGDTTHSTILRIYWDGEEKPSVEAPLSAFFGMAYDTAKEDRDGRYPTLISEKIVVAPGRGLNSWWEMPFRKECRIEVENRGKEDAVLFYMIEGWKGEIGDDAMYFHAAYRQEHPVTKGRAYTALEVRDTGGVYCGINFASGLNGISSCWVEGEVKMYIDGERFPSINYSGTEDYFCSSYAFGNDMEKRRYQCFSSSHAGLAAHLGGRGGWYDGQERFILYRHHVSDPVYFSSSFRMTMDNLGWTGPRYDDYTSVAFYYLPEPSPVPFALPSDSEMVMGNIIPSFMKE